jgi:spore coat protein CotH
MGLVKNVGDKLDTKIKSGELKESELITEATDIMNKMKNMPGMGNIQSILSKMGMNGKANTAAMEANLNQKMKMAKTKERIRAKAEANTKAKMEKQMEQLNTPQINQNKILVKIINCSIGPNFLSCFSIYYIFETIKYQIK